MSDDRSARGRTRPGTGATASEADALRAAYADHLRHSLAKDEDTATNRDRFLSLAMAVRDRLIDQWIETQKVYHASDARRVNYLSLEFLVGRAMGNSLINLDLYDEAQQAMARGVADGITFPAESISFFKITPVIKNATHIPGGLYTDTFWMAFNEAKWNSLSDQQRKAILKHSGLGIAMLAGWAWTNGDYVGIADMEKAGVKFHTLSDSEIAKMKTTLEPLTDEWLAEAKKRGLPAQEIYDYAKTMAHEYRASR